jgi:hypothetical protein
MFTLKIINEDSSTVRLFTLESVVAHSCFSEQFKAMQMSEYVAADNETKEFVKGYFGVVVDLASDKEYWLAGEDYCYITDMSGKTVHRMLPHAVANMETLEELNFDLAETIKQSSK